MGIRLTAAVRKQRIEVINDVLERLQLGAMTVRTGRYACLKENWTADSVAIKKAVKANGSQSLQPIINVVEAHCQVCARGAIMFSKIRKLNEVDVAAVVDSDGSVNCGQQTTTDLLGDIFDVTDLALIEAAFEMSTTLADAKLDEEDLEAAAEFGRGYASDPSLRLAAIMNNMIENNGEFVF